MEEVAKAVSNVERKVTCQETAQKGVAKAVSNVERKVTCQETAQKEVGSVAPEGYKVFQM